jgi:lipoprotein-releasing system permease protein
LSVLPFAHFEWVLALRYLRARSEDSFLGVITLFSFLGIALGVATLIVVTSMMNGSHHELMDKIVGVDGHAFLQSTDKPMTDWREVQTKIAALEEVSLVAPLVEGLAGVSSPFGQSGVRLRGIHEQDLARLPGVIGNLRAGTLQDFDETGGVAIGQRLANNLGVRVGDKISVMSAKGARTPLGGGPRIKSYPIVAIVGALEGDNLSLYLPFTEAQELFVKGNEATLFEVFLKDPNELDAFRSHVGRSIERPLLVTDWRQRNKTFFDAIQVEKNALFVILSFVVIVAAFNIVAGLTMLVKQKTRDIAILRTMGLSRSAVLRIFLIIGGAIGFAGTSAGFVVGLALAKNIDAIRQLLGHLLRANLFPGELYFLSRLPSTVEPMEVGIIVAMALLLSTLAALYPAWKAASLDPIDALRSG